MQHKRQRIGLMIPLLVTIFLGILFFVIAHFLVHTPKQVNALASWLETNHFLLLAVRTAILGVFFFSWPIYIRHKAKACNWPPQHIRLAINLRYYLVLVLIAMNVLFQWGTLQ